MTILHGNSVNYSLSWKYSLIFKTNTHLYFSRLGVIHHNDLILLVIYAISVGGVHYISILHMLTPRWNKWLIFVNDIEWL